MLSMKNSGNITIPANCDVWPHELRTARALAADGRSVTFVRRIGGNRVRTPDIQMDGVLWEMKCPETGNVRSLQRVLRRAATQSPNVIIDSSRMRGTSDADVEHELRRLLPFVGRVRRLLFVSKSRQIIDLTS